MDKGGTFEYTTPESSGDSALESDIRESSVRLRAKSSEVSNTAVGGSELVSGRSIVLPLNFVGSTQGPDSPCQSFVPPKASLQANSQQLGSNKPQDHYDPVEEQVSGGLHRAATVYVNDINSSRLVVPESSHDATNYQSSTESVPLLPIRHEGCSKSLCVKNSKSITCLVIALLLVVGFFAGLTVLALVPGTEHHQIHINNHDMILLGYFDTFWYHTFEIHKADDDHCDGCNLSVYSIFPEDLLVSDNDYNGTTDVVIASQDDVLLRPQYFITGSKIKLQISFLPNSGQDVLVHINIYNDILLYEQFRRGEKPPAMETHQVNETMFSMELAVITTGYYFVGISPILTPISFQYSFKVHQVYYNKDNYGAPQCSLQTSEHCSLTFPTSFTDSYSEKLQSCVLIYSELPSVVTSSYYVSVNYSVYRGFWTAYSILLLLCGCLALVCTSTLCFYWCACCVCNIHRSRKNRSVSFSNYYSI